jgi:hypothetical protein
MSQNSRGSDIGREGYGSFTDVNLFLGKPSHGEKKMLSQSNTTPIGSYDPLVFACACACALCSGLCHFHMRIVGIGQVPGLT